MPTFTSYSMPVGSATNMRASYFTWTAISPSKIIWFFRNEEGATDKVFAQIVNFNGSSAPTYGPVCYIDTATNLNMVARAAHSGDNQVVFACTPNTTTAINIYLLAFDNDDKIYVQNTYASQYTIANATYGHAAFAIAKHSSGIVKFIGGIGTTLGEINIATLTISGTSISFFTNGTIASYFSSSSPRTITARQNIYNNAEFVTQASSTGNSTTNDNILISNTGEYSTITGKGIYPVSATMSNNNIFSVAFDTNEYIIKDRGGVTIASGTYRPTSTSIAVDDLIMLDNEHCMIVTNNGNGPDNYNTTNTTGGNNNISVFVIKINQTTHAITSAVTYPVTITAVFPYAFSHQNSLHRIDLNTVAHIAMYNPDGGTTAVARPGVTIMYV